MENQTRSSIKRIKLLGVLICLVYPQASNAQIWPIAPIDRPHGVYGTFANPGIAYTSTRVRARSYLERDVEGFAGYHVGIDIPVNDAVGETPVYSMRQGVVEYYGDVGKNSGECRLYRLEISHPGGGFIYGHVRSVVNVGEEVYAGQLIGYTCLGAWHLHLGEYENVGDNIRYLNPLPRLPYDDMIPPRVIKLNKNEFSSSRVDAAVLTDDPQSLKDWDTAPMSNLHVYSLRVRLFKHGVMLSDRLLFQLDRIPNYTLRRHFDLPRTSRNMPVAECVNAPQGTNCNGSYYVRLWRGSKKMAPGWYGVEITATDTMGNHTTKKFGMKVS